MNDHSTILQLFQWTGIVLLYHSSDLFASRPRSGVSRTRTENSKTSETKILIVLFNVFCFSRFNVAPKIWRSATNLVFNNEGYFQHAFGTLGSYLGMVYIFCIRRMVNWFVYVFVAQSLSHIEKEEP